MERVVASEEVIGGLAEAFPLYLALTWVEPAEVGVNWQVAM
jgi:hypothetical protein